MISLFTQAAAHLETVGSGHQHVEDDDVGIVVGDVREAVVAVDRGPDVVALVSQRAGNRVTDGLVVLDYENPPARSCGVSRGHECAS
jgi:hypothetical protein